MNLRKDHYWLYRAARPRSTRLSPLLPPRVSRRRAGLPRLSARASPTGARALVWARSPAGRPDGPAPPLRQSEPAAPTGSSEGRRRRVGTVARWRWAPGSRPATTGPGPPREPRPKARAGGFALTAARAPPGTQLSSLLRREHGGFNVSSPLPRRGKERPGVFFPPIQTLVPSTNVATRKHSEKQYDS